MSFWSQISDVHQNAFSLLKLKFTCVHVQWVSYCVSLAVSISSKCIFFPAIESNRFLLLFFYAFWLPEIVFFFTNEYDRHGTEKNQNYALKSWLERRFCFYAKNNRTKNDKIESRPTKNACLACKQMDKIKKNTECNSMRWKWAIKRHFICMCSLLFNIANDSFLWSLQLLHSWALDNYGCNAFIQFLWV